MKTIYKDLKVKDNKLIFKNDVIYNFNIVSKVDEMKMNNSIKNIKDNLYCSQKRYLGDHVEYNITKEKDIITLNLFLINEDKTKYKRSIIFSSLLDNQLLIL